MRIFLRTTLITVLLVFSVLMIWSFMHSTNVVPSAQAATGLDVPSYCIPPELDSINTLLAETTSTKGKQLLLQKKQDAETYALECAKNATAHPPAKKPKNPVQVEPLRQNISPEPVVTFQVGIQNANVIPVPQSMFLPLDGSKNLWQGIISGKLLRIVAGSMKDDNWQEHPDLPRQGAVSVWVDHSMKNGGDYITPTRHGVLRFVAACGTKLTLQATDGTTFIFDAATQTYVSNAHVCPTVTP